MSNYVLSPVLLYRGSFRSTDLIRVPTIPPPNSPPLPRLPPTQTEVPRDPGFPCGREDDTLDPTGDEVRLGIEGVDISPVSLTGEGHHGTSTVLRTVCHPVDPPTPSRRSPVPEGSRDESESFTHPPSLLLRVYTRTECARRRKSVAQP